MAKSSRPPGSGGGSRMLGVRPSIRQGQMAPPLGARVARPGVSNPFIGGAGQINANLPAAPPLGFRPPPQIGTQTGGFMPQPGGMSPMAPKTGKPGITTSPYARAPIAATARPFDGTGNARGGAPKRIIAGRAGRGEPRR